MDPRTACGGAVAVLLRPDRTARAEAAGREPVRRLRAVVGAELLELLDGWAEAGATGEQLLCAADMLRARAEDDPELTLSLGALTATQETLEALAELAGAFHRSGQWGAAAWCAERFADVRTAVGSASAGPAVLPAPFPARGAAEARARDEVLARLPGFDADAVEPEWVDEETARDLLAMVASVCAGGDLSPAEVDAPETPSSRTA
jgi:hypothetical protein